jgi:hypothetical protein
MLSSCPHPTPCLSLPARQSGLMATRDLRLVAVQSKESPAMIAADPDRCLMDGDT